MSEVTDGCLLEVVVSAQSSSEEDVEIRPHSLSIHSYKTPTFCDFCGEMLFGMFKQVNVYWYLKMNKSVDNMYFLPGSQVRVVWS